MRSPRDLKSGPLFYVTSIVEVVAVRVVLNWRVILRPLGVHQVYFSICLRGDVGLEASRGWRFYARAVISVGRMFEILRKASRKRGPTSEVWRCVQNPLVCAASWNGGTHCPCLVESRQQY